MGMPIMALSYLYNWFILRVEYRHHNDDKDRSLYKKFLWFCYLCCFGAFIFLGVVKQDIYMNLFMMFFAILTTITDIIDEKCQILAPVIICNSLIVGTMIGLIIAH